MEKSEGEIKIISALKKLGGKAYQKKIADAAKMSTQTASKYLNILYAKDLVKKDSSQPPHIHWELKDRVG